MVSVDIKLFVPAFLLSIGITGMMMIYARRAKLLDLPNQRSSHEIPTPRGGGLGIVVVFLAAVTILFGVNRMPSDVFWSLFVGGTLVAGIGFADDHRHVPAQWRFLVQIVAATLALSALGGFPDIRIGDQLVALGIFGDILAVIFTVWLVNLYNFMDGIDGIAAVEALCITGGAMVLLAPGEAGFVVDLLTIFVAGVCGFLIWNWPPAKIFMGDVGSGFVGFVLAIFAIVSSIQGVLPVWCWLTLAGVFVIDATITLVIRVINGERWYVAHNRHAYQKAARRFQGHRPVTLAVLIINLCWLLPLAWFASVWPEFGWWLTALAWTPLVVLAMFLRAGHPDPASLEARG